MTKPAREWLGKREDTLGIMLGAVVFTAALFITSPSIYQSIDFVLFYEPNFDFLLDSLRAQQLPLWNPYVGLGRPYLADLQSAVFYPPIYLLCLGKHVGVFLLICGHVALGGFGMKMLGRALGLSKAVTCLLACAFVASMPFSGRLFAGQIFYVCALAYVPMLFAFTIGCHEALTWRNVSAFAVALALQILCGHPQVSWLSMIAIVSFVLARSSTTTWRNALVNGTRGICGLALAATWGFALAAVALLPFLELVQQGNRPHPSAELASFAKLRFVHLLTLGSMFPSGFVDWERNLFFGLPLLAASIAGLSNLRDRNVRGLIFAAVAATIIGLADSSPLFDTMFRFLPGYAHLRIHSRMGFVIVFALIMIAGIWIERSHPWLRWVLRANAPLTRKDAFVFLAALQLLHLSYANWNAKRVYSFETIFQHSPNYPFTQELLASLKAADLLRREQTPPRVCVPPRLVPANFAITHQYSTVDAYTSLFLNRPWQYLHHVFDIRPHAGQNTSVHQALYDHGPFLRKELAIDTGVDANGLSLVVNTSPAPRAFLVYGVQQVADAAEAIRMLRAGHDLYQRALIETPPAQLSHHENRLASRDAVFIEKFTPNSITCKVHAEKNAWLVLAEAWYPGWKAVIQNERIASIPANAWMRTFPVPRGDHTVIILFQQNWLLTGAIISIISIALLIFARFGKPRDPARANNSMALRRTDNPY